MAEGDLVSTKSETLDYVIKDPLELNLSYMPFINHGGLFIPTSKSFSLGEKLTIDLKLPTRKETIKIEGKVIWITPKNALHHVLPGVGVQFIGPNSKATQTLIESQLDRSTEIGGYTYGITGGELRKK